MIFAALSIGIINAVSFNSKRHERGSCKINVTNQKPASSGTWNKLLQLNVKGNDRIIVRIFHGERKITKHMVECRRIKVLIKIKAKKEWRESGISEELAQVAEKI